MFSELYELMIMMVLLMAVGYLLRRAEIITAAGRKCLTDVILYAIMPCNIIKAFSTQFEDDFMRTFLLVLLAAMFAQTISLITARLCYNRMPQGERQVFQYATVCSNAGFMGLPMAEGVFGSTGLLYASVFLIPQRVVMWTAGVSYFQTGGSRKEVYRKVLTHPCMIATYIGLTIMAFQVTLPGALGRTIQSLSSCCTAMTMLYIGTILVDVPFRQMADRRQIYFAVIRLFLIPLVVLEGCRLVHLNAVAAGVCALLSAMPAGSTTSLLAAKYGADERSAAKCVVFTTALSAVTVPVWSMMLLGLAA